MIGDATREDLMRSLGKEKVRRVYYQDIVYHACIALDRFHSRRPGRGIVCGTADEPSDAVQREIDALIPAWIAAEAVNEQCWWWWWNGDEDCCPVPVSIMHSCTGAGLTDGTYFASQGQLGWNHPQDVTEMGGLWMKITEPEIPKNYAEA